MNRRATRTPRRQSQRLHRTLDAVLGLLTLAMVAGLVAVVVVVYRQDLVERVRVDLRTGAVGNALRVGSEVKVRGVPIGRVEDIRPADEGAVLTLALQPSDAARIPADTRARLLPATLFGERFVSLLAEPLQSGAPALSDGDEIEEDRSAESVELQEVFDDLLPLLQAVQPEKLSAMLGELAATLRGQGADLGDTAELLARYLGRLNPLVPQLSDDLAALGRVADDYAEALPDLLASFDDLAVTTRTLVDQREALAASLRRVTGAADSGTGFVSGNEQTIVVLSAESRRALSVVRPFARTFPCTFAALRDFVPEMDAVLGAGTGRPGLQADVTVVAARDGYQPRIDAPTYGASGADAKPVCPQSASTPDADPVKDPAALDLGQPNSPQENSVLSELLAPGADARADELPAWGSLLLGPLLRDSELVLR